MLGYAGLNEIALDPLDAAVRSFFIQLHQAAVTCDVASHDGSQPTRHRAARRHTISPRLLEVANFGHAQVSANRKTRCRRHAITAPEDLTLSSWQQAIIFPGWDKPTRNAQAATKRRKRMQRGPIDQAADRALDGISM